MSSTCRIGFFLAMLLLTVRVLAADIAIFAGGCFWCLEHDFSQLPGVSSVTSGYIGGKAPHPTYQDVSSGKTGYVEAVEVVYDPDQITYEQLLLYYWHNIDPTRDDGQFCDKGSQYRPVIFYTNENQKRLAEVSKAALKVHPNKVEILPATHFYPAEAYHQDYAEKNAWKYKYYRYRCGRDERLEELWGPDFDKLPSRSAAEDR